MHALNCCWRLSIYFFLCTLNVKNTRLKCLFTSIVKINPLLPRARRRNGQESDVLLRPASFAQNIGHTKLARGNGRHQAICYNIKQKIRTAIVSEANCFQICFLSKAMLSANSFWTFSQIYAIVFWWCNINSLLKGSMIFAVFNVKFQLSICNCLKVNSIQN